LLSRVCLYLGRFFRDRPGRLFASSTVLPGETGSLTVQTDRSFAMRTLEDNRPRLFAHLDVVCTTPRNSDWKDVSSFSADRGFAYLNHIIYGHEGRPGHRKYLRVREESGGFGGNTPALPRTLATKCTRISLQVVRN